MSSFPGLHSFKHYEVGQFKVIYPLVFTCGLRIIVNALLYCSHLKVESQQLLIEGQGGELLLRYLTQICTSNTILQ